MQIMNYVSQALNEGNYCIAVFLDLRKAFDVCDHEILLKKLEKMGIRGIAYTWFKNYLAGRSQFVDINGEHSSTLNIAISVIQGSILGPILFCVTLMIFMPQRLSLQPCLQTIQLALAREKISIY